jgi:hypothetical protein
MRGKAEGYGESDLEREFELEMDDGSDRGSDSESGRYGSTGMGEAPGDEELEREFELLGETDGGMEQDSEAGYGDVGDYADRLYELSQREFESEREVEGAVRDVLDDMEREYFFGRLVRAAKKAARGPIGRLVKKGASLAGGLPAFQGLRSLTRMAREGLKGPLGAMLTQAVASAVPGGSAALPMLRALGVQLPGDQPTRETFEDLVSISREAFDHLAANISDQVDQPLEASRVASAALQAAVGRRSRGRPLPARNGGSGDRVRRIVLGPHEQLIVIRR